MSDVTPRQPARTLVWSDQVLDLFDPLRMLGADAYVVGGAVRDAYLGRPVKDLDLATSASGTRLARQIADMLGGAYYPLDVERDTGRVILETQDGKLVIDVARFRGADLSEDLRDRDFTINAMAVDLAGDPGWIIDPTGGESDARDKILRRCHADAVASDPVRVLRGIRQSVQLGFRIEPATLADLRANAPLLRDVSPERVRDEWFRLLNLPKASAALKIADAIGALRIVLPEASSLHAQNRWQATLDTIDRLIEIFLTISPQRTDQTAAKFSLGMLVMGLDKYRSQLQAHVLTSWADERSHQALLLFALLLSAVDLSAAEARARQMPLSNREMDRLSLLLRTPDGYGALGEDRSALTLHRYWRRFGDAGVDLCLLALARTLAHAGINLDQNGWIREIELARALLEAHYDRHDEIVAPPMMMNGNDLMSALDLKPGPRIGALLDAIREAQVTGQVRTADDALALARHLLLDGIE